MGEAHTAVVDDGYAPYWNPAALSQVRYAQAALMHNRLFEGMDQQYVAYVHPMAGRAVAGSLSRFSVGSFDSYNANGVRRGEVDSSDIALGLSYGHRLGLVSNRGPSLSLGLGGKWIRESLGRFSAQTFAVDLGLLATQWEWLLGERARGLKLGAAVRNIGPGLKFHSESAPLPRTFSAGLALERRPWKDPLTVALDFKSAVDDGNSFSFGVEYRLRRVLAVRTGYVAGQDEGLGVRFGFGVELKRIAMEYAIAGFGSLGSMHRFGLTLRLGGPADLREKSAQDFLEQGRRYLRQNRFYEASVEFNEALELDRGNSEALKLLQETAKGLDAGGERD